LGVGLVITRSPVQFTAVALSCYNLGQVVHTLVPVSFSSNALASISVVALHRTRLVRGWVTILGRVNHLGTEPGTQVNSA